MKTVLSACFVLFVCPTANGALSFSNSPRNISACETHAQISGGFKNSTCFQNATTVSLTSQLLSSESTKQTSTELTTTELPTSLGLTSTQITSSLDSKASGVPVPISNGTYYYPANSTSIISSQVSGKPLTPGNGTIHYSGNTTSSIWSPSQVSQLQWTTSAVANATSTPAWTNSSSRAKGNLRVAAVAAVAGKYVFAHFMVSNTVYYTIANWEEDMALAQASSIDAFVMNMARDEVTNGQSLANAFIAANTKGFKLFFSFDYAGNGLWKQADVIALINQYKNNAAYFKRGSQPLVSTFEGPQAASDWPSIKDITGCYFVPSWSSLGAKSAMETGVVDGLFSWAGWPDGPNDMFTTVDESYRAFLLGKTYMMPVSPWFFTNMPGFRKNWLWRGDSLWYDRWQQIVSMEPAHQPEYLQIITWNDWGESHYIGPLRYKEYGVFDRGMAPFNYVSDMPHDGWRLFLPYVISFYKNGRAPIITKVGLVIWYRPTRNNACSSGGTTGNTASQLQNTYSPGTLAQNKIFFTALLTGTLPVTVTVGGVTLAATWENTPANGGPGLYHGTADFGSNTGVVVVSVGSLRVTGIPIAGSCPSGIINWNAWVGSSEVSISNHVQPSVPQGCIAGTGPTSPGFKVLCEFTCRYDYCPESCTCTQVGNLVPLPTAVANHGCPVAGFDKRWDGLCSFSCNRNFCPSAFCVTRPTTFVCNSPAVVAPPVPVCVSGERAGTIWNGLCGYTCRYGFCPPEICDCRVAGVVAATAPPLTSVVGRPIASEPDFGLCAWACSHGLCPSNVCTVGESSTPGGGVSIGRYVSPPKATVIPFPGLGTPLAPSATFTLNPAVYTDISNLQNLGNQNSPKGPGAGTCLRCDFLRLITATCCGVGGGVSNPIQIPAGTVLPRDLILRPGFRFTQEWTLSNGIVYRPGYILKEEIIIPAGVRFDFDFKIDGGAGLSNTYTPGQETSDDLLYIRDDFWSGPLTISCDLPCSFLLPPFVTKSTWTPTAVTVSNQVITTVVQTTMSLKIDEMTIKRDDNDFSLILFAVPKINIRPLCLKIWVPILGNIEVGFCPPKIDPFPPPPPPRITIVPVVDKPGPTAALNKPGPALVAAIAGGEGEEDGEEEDNNFVCPIDGSYESEFDDEWYNEPEFGGSGNTPFNPGGGSGAGLGNPTNNTITVTHKPQGPSQTSKDRPSPTPNPNPDTVNPDTNQLRCTHPERSALDPRRHRRLLDEIFAHCNATDGKILENNNQEARVIANMWNLHNQTVHNNTGQINLVLGVQGFNNCRTRLNSIRCRTNLLSITANCIGLEPELSGGNIENNCELWFIGPRNW